MPGCRRSRVHFIAVRRNLAAGSFPPHTASNPRRHVSLGPRAHATAAAVLPSRFSTTMQQRHTDRGLSENQRPLSSLEIGACIEEGLLFPVTTSSFLATYSTCYFFINQPQSMDLQTENVTERGPSRLNTLADFRVAPSGGAAPGGACRRSGAA